MKIMLEHYWKSWELTAPGFEDAHKYIRTITHDAPSATVIWKTRHKQVVTVEIPEEIKVEDVQNRNVVWKDYYEKRFFRYLFRPSLAYREWKNYVLVESMGIPVAKPLAIGEYRKGLRLTRSYILTRRVMNCNDGRVFYPSSERNSDRKSAMEFAEQNMRYLGILHRCGYTHGGFHPRNELFHENNGKLEVIWIDLATIRKPRPWEVAERRATDLREFCDPLQFSAEEKERLMQIYKETLAGQQ